MRLKFGIKIIGIQILILEICSEEHLKKASAIKKDIKVSN